MIDIPDYVVDTLFKIDRTLKKLKVRDLESSPHELRLYARQMIGTGPFSGNEDQMRQLMEKLQTGLTTQAGI